MRLSRIIMALTVGLAVAAVPTAAGAAQPQPSPSTSAPQPPPGYVPQPPVVTLDDPTITLGQSFILRGSGFTPNTAATIDVTRTDLPAAAPAPGTARRSDGSAVALAEVAYQLPPPTHFTVQVDQHGNFTTTYRPDRPGRYTFTAQDAVTRLTASTTGTVLPVRQPGRHGHGGLPVTGSSISTPMKIGGGLLGAGAVLVLLSLAWRRRSRFGLGSR